MAKNPCALCGVPLGLFEKKELVCCGETQIFCSTCYEQMYDLNHFERTRILLERGRPANPEKMRPILKQYDEEQADKKIRDEEVAVNAYSSGLTCLRCGVPMRNLGKRYFTAFPVPNPYTRYQYDLLELFLLRCDRCGKTEFISNDSILKNFAPEADLLGEMIECPACGSRHAPNGGCPRCAMNNAADRISSAPKSPKKPAPGKKPPWEK